MVIESIKVGTTPKDLSKLYAFETPPLEPGDYEIITKQTVTASGERTQVIESTQPVKVQVTNPYSLPQNLIHSYYPPSMRKVDAKLLPHVVFKGATAWERSKKGTNPPTPWLALLLFTDKELLSPAEVMAPGIKPSGTGSLTLPLTEVMNKNNNYSRFCYKEAFPTEEAKATSEGATLSADFIFVSGKSFKMFFEQQSLSPGATSSQVAVDLDRYKYLSLMTDTGVMDATGQATARLSTLIGHRIRPYELGDDDVKVQAHVVSIENLDERINWNAAKIDDAVVALVSLYSWSFTWDKCNANLSLEMFEHLSRPGSTRALMLDMPPVPSAQQQQQEEQPKSQAQTQTQAQTQAQAAQRTDPEEPPVPSPAADAAANNWVRERIDEGYTIVRHRDIAGETSMALYRGPLTPRPTRKPKLGPSIHGTDLQIVDISAQILDVSYSTAWELGRTLAGKDAKFSAAIAELRRDLLMKAVTTSKATEHSNNTDGPLQKDTLMHKSGDVVNSVLDRFDQLFALPLKTKIDGLPCNKSAEEKAARWQVPTPVSNSIAKNGGMMTNAKLRRHLQCDSVKKWLQDETENLCNRKPSMIPSLAIVFKWLVENLMTLKLIPATYIFPDPAVIKDESINCFLIDDLWIDTLVDGAMSLANTMGGGDDPVRDEIRSAFNIYLANAPAELVLIGASGFVLKSCIVESFPDLEISISKANPESNPESNPPVYLPCTNRHKHDNMIFCLVGRGSNNIIVDYDINFKLPPHQQRFSLDTVEKDSLTFEFKLRPYLKDDGKGGATLAPEASQDLEKKVTWARSGEVLVPNKAPYRPIWNWTTGILVPYHIVTMMDEFIDNFNGLKDPKDPKSPKKHPNVVVDKVAADSRSLYLATQLTDKDHSVQVPIRIASQMDQTIRQIFPEPPKGAGSKDVDKDRELANIHDPTKTEPSSAGKQSYLVKKAFSQDSPGRSIPAQSNNPQHIVFSIQIATDKPLPSNVELSSLEVIIPLGEASTDLLDHLAALPTVRTIGSRQQFITAITHRVDEKNRTVIKQLVVHIKPRGGGATSGGATLMKGLDASFVLMKATVNGVMGEDVEIKTTEVYVTRERATEKGRKDVLRKSVVDDKWYLMKE